MNFSAPFIHRPVMTTLIMLMIAFGGIFAFFHLPITDLPSVEKPRIDILTSYSGAAALTVLNQVTVPLEKELSHVAGVKEMTSQSSPGFSQITLSFDLKENMRDAAFHVQSALNRINHELPKDLDKRPTYQLSESGQESLLYILLSSDHAPKNELESYAESNILPQLHRIEGIAQVKVYGSKQSLWLRLNPEIMAARQIGFNQVIDTLKHYFSEKPLGSIRSSSKTLYIELFSPESNPKLLENLVIENSNLRIQDIGEIVSDPDKDKAVYFVTPNQSSTTLLYGIQKLNGANTVAIAKDVEETLNSLKKNLPRSYTLNLWFNKATWIEESIQEVEKALLFALFLVVLVVYLSFGRLQDAIIPSLALPLSLLGTFVILYFAGFNLDLLSLLALTLAVGFIIDDAIVVLENIVRLKEEGMSPLEASLKGSKQIGFTILSMTLSLVAVFIPLLFMGGINGRLFREFSITLTSAILVSGFISLTLTPLLCSRFLKIHKKPKERTAFFRNAYGKALKTCLLHPFYAGLICFALLGSTFFLFPKIQIQLLPEEDRGFITASVQLPTRKETIDPSFLHALILKNPFIENFLSIRLDNSLLFLIRLKQERPPEKEILKDLQRRFDAVPGILTSLQSYQMLQLNFDLGAGSSYKYRIQGSSFAEVEENAERLIEKLRTFPEFASVKLMQDNDTPNLTLHINDTLATHYGITKQSIQELLEHAYGQIPLGALQRGSHKTPLFMELKADYQTGANALSKLFIQSKSGTLFPLKEIVSWEEKLGALNLKHSEHLPTATLRFSLKEGISQKLGLKKMKEIGEEVLIYPLKGEFLGTAKFIASSGKEMILLLLGSTVAMYIILGILYESFIHPLTILSSLPFASLGGILTLILFNEPFSLFSAVGFLLLIGIVKKNGIMIVDYALEMQKKGYSPDLAIYEGCIVRFRPIMMTTFAAIMGALPLAIGFGQGAAMQRGLGLVIVGGLIFSQLLTLFITPIIYLYLESIRNKLKFSFLKI